jgi:hypothetical protein
MKIVIILLSLMLYCTCKSREGNFYNFQYHEDLWVKIDAELGAFFHLDRNGLKGNFQILLVSIKEDTPDTKEYIAKEIRENPGAKIVNIGQKQVAYYIQEIKGDNDSKITKYHWSFRDEANLFTCILSIDAEQSDDVEVLQEIRSCEKAIATLKPV